MSDQLQRIFEGFCNDGHLAEGSPDGRERLWECLRGAFSLGAEAAEAKLATLQAHFDAAAPEHNLPALLDLYQERRDAAEEKVAELQAELDLRAEMFGGQLASLQAQLREGEQECQRLRGQLEAEAAWFPNPALFASERKCPHCGAPNRDWSRVSSSPIQPPPVPQVAEASTTAIVTPCWCRRCNPFDPKNVVLMRMILCPSCGNKRCPHAEWHGFVCSGSNETLLPAIKRHFRRMGLSEPTGSQEEYDPLELAHERILALAPDEPGSDEALRDITGLLCDAIRERCDPPSSVGFITRAELAGTPLTVEAVLRRVLRAAGRAATWDDFHAALYAEIERAAKEQT